MRIITGKFKGRILNAPKNNSVRPTSDKVKEAVFSMIREQIEGSVIIDLFSGTGSLGLEGLSGGAKKCYFCDNSKESLDLIKSNIDLCGVTGSSTLIYGSYRKALARIKEKADVIFLDPPYEKKLVTPCLELIKEFNALNRDGVIVCEHMASEALPDELSGFCKVNEKKYGTILVSLYG